MVLHSILLNLSQLQVLTLVQTNSFSILLMIFRNQVQRLESNHAKEFFLASLASTKIVFTLVKVLENCLIIYLTKLEWLDLEDSQEIHIISEKRKAEEE